MKLEAFDSEKKEKVVIIKAEKGRYGNIDIIAVNEKMEDVPGGILIRLNSDGSFERFHGINKELGFRLDSKGRIIESE